MLYHPLLNSEEWRRMKTCPIVQMTDAIMTQLQPSYTDGGRVLVEHSQEQQEDILMASLYRERDLAQKLIDIYKGES